MIIFQCLLSFNPAFLFIFLPSFLVFNVAKSLVQQVCPPTHARVSRSNRLWPVDFVRPFCGLMSRHEDKSRAIVYLFTISYDLTQQHPVGRSRIIVNGLNGERRLNQRTKRTLHLDCVGLIVEVDRWSKRRRGETTGRHNLETIGKNRCTEDARCANGHGPTSCSFSAVDLARDARTIT